MSSPKVPASLATAVILFMAVVTTTACCFFCTCRYLARRRQRLQSPFAGRHGAATRSPDRWGLPRAAEGQLGALCGHSHSDAHGCL